MTENYGYSYETAHTAIWFRNQKRVVKGITIHHWGSRGSSFDGIAYDWFCKTNDRQTSANYVAQGANADGTISKRVACIVDPDLIAYHAGVWQANVDTIGIECRPEARDADYEVVAELIARLWITYGVVPLYPHKHWVTTDCPGAWDLNRLKTEATAKMKELQTPHTIPTPVPPTTGGNPVPTVNDLIQGMYNRIFGMLRQRYTKADGTVVYKPEADAKPTRVLDSADGASLQGKLDKILAQNQTILDHLNATPPKV